MSSQEWISRLAGKVGVIVGVIFKGHRGLSLNPVKITRYRVDTAIAASKIKCVKTKIKITLNICEQISLFDEKIEFKLHSIQTSKNDKLMR